MADGAQRVAIVTGSESGIGRAVDEALSCMDRLLDERFAAQQQPRTARATPQPSLA